MNENKPLESFVSLVLTGQKRTASKISKALNKPFVLRLFASMQFKLGNTFLKGPSTFLSGRRISSNAGCSSNYSAAFADIAGVKGVLPFDRILTRPCRVCDSPCCCAVFLFLRPIPQKAVSLNQTVDCEPHGPDRASLTASREPSVVLLIKP